MSDRAKPSQRKSPRNSPRNSPRTTRRNTPDDAPASTAAAPPKPERSGSETRQRKVFLHMRATPEEKAETEARAELAGLSVSGYLRAAVFGKDAEQPRAARRPAVEAAELGALRYELRKIGGNLNQIAHRLNQGKEFDARAFAAIYAEHAAVLRAILQALGKETEP